VVGDVWQRCPGSGGGDATEAHRQKQGYPLGWSGDGGGGVEIDGTLRRREPQERTSHAQATHKHERADVTVEMETTKRPHRCCGWSDLGVYQEVCKTPVSAVS
jgi:hypothetical protein